MINANEIHERMERSKRLKAARKSADFKGPADVARAAGWSAREINRYKGHESGRNGFGISDAKVYADLFGVEVGWLMTGDGIAGQQIEIEGEPLWKKQIVTAVSQALEEGADQTEVIRWTTEKLVEGALNRARPSLPADPVSAAIFAAVGRIFGVDMSDTHTSEELGAASP